jgi:hypothetical protein
VTIVSSWNVEGGHVWPVDAKRPKKVDSEWRKAFRALIKERVAKRGSTRA